MASRETFVEPVTELSRDALIERVRELEAQLAEAQTQIAELRRQLFGPKAEKLSAEQQAQLDTLSADLREDEQQPSPLIREVLVEEHQRRRPQPARHPVPPVLETETVTLEPAAGEKHCPHCGHPKQKIGEEVTEEIDLIPAKLIRRRTVRPKYACRCGEAGVVIAPLSPRLIPQSKLGLGLAIHILLARYDDHLSFYALERIFRERHAVEIPRQQIVQWVEHIAGWLQPVYDALWKTMRTSGYLQIDETLRQSLRPESEGQGCAGLLVVLRCPPG